MTDTVDSTWPPNWPDFRAQHAAAHVLDARAREVGIVAPEAPAFDAMKSIWSRADPIGFQEFLTLAANVTLAYKRGKLAEREGTGLPAADEGALCLEMEANSYGWFKHMVFMADQPAWCRSVATEMGETYLTTCATLVREYEEGVGAFMTDKVRVDSLLIANPKDIKVWAERYWFMSKACPAAHFRGGWGHIAAYAENLAKGGKPTDEKLFRDAYLALVPSVLKSSAVLASA